jgi:hypothetical protein
MSAFAMHAKTSAFAAGARVLSSQKKTNNSNRCERPFPQSFLLCNRVAERGKFVFLILCGKERSERKREREKGGLCVHIQ